MKKVFSMILAAVMLFALAVSAGAAEVSSEAGNEISPQYVALSTLSPTLTFSGKNVTCAVLARTKESTAKITLSMTLYEVSSSGLMTKVAGWNNLTGTGRVSARSTPMQFPAVPIVWLSMLPLRIALAPITTMSTVAESARKLVEEKGGIQETVLDTPMILNNNEGGT